MSSRRQKGSFWGTWPLLCPRMAHWDVHSAVCGQGLGGAYRERHAGRDIYYFGRQKPLPPLSGGGKKDVSVRGPVALPTNLAYVLKTMLRNCRSGAHACIAHIATLAPPPKIICVFSPHTFAYARVPDYSRGLECRLSGLRPSHRQTQTLEQ